MTIFKIEFAESSGLVKNSSATYMIGKKIQHHKPLVPKDLQSLPPTFDFNLDSTDLTLKLFMYQKTHHYHKHYLMFYEEEVSLIEETYKIVDACVQQLPTS